ncbi:MAG: hypothetical protein ABSD53_15520 [Terriglobales bacterium]|jgi:hypothetical protein
MSQAAVILKEPIDVRNRLAELGLEEEDLRFAVQRGAAAAAECTDNHPIQAPGFYRWSEAIAAKRERLLPKGWERFNDGGLPFTVDPTGTIAITVAAGDEFTGCPDKNPSTKSSKGPRTFHAVEDNSQLPLLFDGVPIRPEHLTSSHGRMTWLLLAYPHYGSREIKSELSRPVRMGEDNRVQGWAERIILSSIPFDGDVLSVPVDNAPKTPELDVPIRRRA